MEVSLTDEQRAEAYVQKQYDTRQVVLGEYPMEPNQFPVKLWKYTAFIEDMKVGGWVSTTIVIGHYSGAMNPEDARDMHAGRLLQQFGAAKLAQMMKAPEHDPDDVPDEINV